jgi:hypothetical protein
MELIDIRMVKKMNEDKTNTLRKYKGIQGTIKSIEFLKPNDSNDLLVASCGLDRHLRIHNVENGNLTAKIYLKSRLNCLLHSKYEPIKKTNNSTSQVARNELEDDQSSNVNSKDIGTDDLWSDMETIIDEHPTLDKKNSKNKRKLEDRLEEFGSELDESEISNKVNTNKKEEFKKPK